MRLFTYILVCIVSLSSIVHAVLSLPEAAYTGNEKAVISFLKSGINPNTRDSFGGTALHAAMFQNNTHIITLLLRYKANINAQGLSNGYTPLHDAVWANNVSAAKILLAHGANACIKNKDQLTPYALAKSTHKTTMMHVLKNACKNST